MAKRCGEMGNWPAEHQSAIGPEMDLEEQEKIFIESIVKKWQKFGIDYKKFDSNDQELLTDVEADEKRIAELGSIWQREKNESGREDNPMGTYFEFALAEGIHAENWLGDKENVPQVEVIKTSQGDDLRGTDLVLIISGKEGESICLAIDAVCSDNPAVVREKIGRNFKSIYHGYLPAELKFLQSEQCPELERRQNLPRVVVGVDSAEGKRLLKLFAHKIKTRKAKINKMGQLNADIEDMESVNVEQDPVTDNIKEQIKNQLVVSLELAVGKFVTTHRAKLSAEDKIWFNNLRQYWEKLKAEKNVTSEFETQEFEELISLLTKHETTIKNLDGQQPALVENIYRHLAVLDYFLNNVIKKASPSEKPDGARTGESAVHDSLVIANKELYHDLF